MLTTAFIVLAIAVALGSILAVLHMRPRDVAAPPWSLGAAHGLIAIGGLGCLALALRGPPRGLEEGAGSFGAIAAVLVALAALFGLVLLSTRLRKRRLSGGLIGIHATLAISGFIVLIAYVLA